MEHHSAMKTNKLWMHVTTWLHLKSIKLNERSLDPGMGVVLVWGNLSS